MMETILFWSAGFIAWIVPQVYQIILLSRIVKAVTPDPALIARRLKQAREQQEALKQEKKEAAERQDYMFKTFTKFIEESKGEYDKETNGKTGTVD